MSPASNYRPPPASPAPTPAPDLQPLLQLSGGGKHALPHPQTPLWLTEAGAPPRPPMASGSWFLNFCYTSSEIQYFSFLSLPPFPLSGPWKHMKVLFVYMGKCCVLLCFYWMGWGGLGFPE